VWICEGENEAIRMCFVSPTAVPRNGRVSTKKKSFTAANDSECCPFVITLSVEICRLESISIYR
jgi:hypothetical protein